MAKEGINWPEAGGSDFSILSHAHTHTKQTPNVNTSSAEVRYLKFPVDFKEEATKGRMLSTSGDSICMEDVLEKTSALVETPSTIPHVHLC